MPQPTTANELRGKSPMPPVDPNTKIPKSVADQGARAEAIQRAITGQPEPQPQVPTAQAPLTGDGNAPTGQEPPTAPPMQPPQEVQLTPPAPIAPPAQVQGGPPMPDPQDVVSPEEWEQRYKAMKGRFDQQASHINQMGEMIQRLQSHVSHLENNAPPPPLPSGATLITEQEMNDYGPEFVDMVRRAAAEVAAPLHAEVQNLRGQLGTVQQETANAFLTRMNATIGGLVPNWQQLNNDPRFIHWVGLPEVYSGIIRQKLMQDAWNNGDAHRVAAFFRAFLAEEAAVDPRSAGSHVQPTPPAPNMVPTPPVPRLSLDQLAAPGRAHSAAQTPADKPVYTAQDITRFYTECAAGKWRTREVERAAIDADIIAAQREGRIIPDQRTIRPTERNGHW